ncbi:DUF1127 domain-containing protein [Kosakonia sp. H02]|nr:DUF1127 domain-containing protein [Kosakonia sp. H02]
MQVFENRPNSPFFAAVLLWRKVQRWRANRKTRLLLLNLSDHQLKDLGLRRDELL